MRSNNSLEDALLFFESYPAAFWMAPGDEFFGRFEVWETRALACCESRFFLRIFYDISKAFPLLLTLKLISDIYPFLCLFATNV